MIMNIDYKALDTQKVVDYILSFSEEVLVVNIIQNSGGGT